MSHDTSWDIEKYRDDHESHEQWELRQAFMEKWKEEYPEERLVCLARVFANIEFLGCRYPIEVMKEVARLSEEIAKSYRKNKKSKLQRTFVSASDAANDRAKGVKREGGNIVGGPPSKTSKISFVPQGQAPQENNGVSNKQSSDSEEETSENNKDNTKMETTSSDFHTKEYIQEIYKMQSLNIRMFNEEMFNTQFGRFVLMIRPWISKLENIVSSCLNCNALKNIGYENGCYSLSINNTLLASANGSKAEAKPIVENIAWQKLTSSCVLLLMKQQFVAQNDARITTSDVSGKRNRAEQFGTTIESSVATKMMKLMGWTGGGLGANSQGREEPVQAHLQMVNRAGLGSYTDARRLRQSATNLMRRYFASDTSDVDLVFSSDFTKEERATLHLIAKRTGLASNSYGKDEDRFLVVRRKRKNPFDLVREVVGKGGETAKYQVIIPPSLR